AGGVRALDLALGQARLGGRARVGGSVDRRRLDGDDRLRGDEALGQWTRVIAARDEQRAVRQADGDVAVARGGGGLRLLPGARGDVVDLGGALVVVVLPVPARPPDAAGHDRAPVGERRQPRAV